MQRGCNLRRVAIQPKNQLAVPERPSSLDVSEEQSVVDPAAMQMDLVTPAFQPYRGATGRAWMACSFNLGPEPFDPEGQGRLPSDEWLDDYQQ